MPGPARTPTPILKLRGSWRAEGRRGELRLPVKAPSCPAWLGREAKAEWARQVKHLVAAGVIAEIDRGLLAAYCAAVGEWERLEAGIAKHVAADPEAGYAAAIAEGLLNARNKAFDRMLKVGQQFGFTPAARTRLHGSHPEEKPKDGKGRFFQGA